MTDTLLLVFRILAVSTGLLVPFLAYRRRGRLYAMFGGVLLGFSIPGAWATSTRLADWASEAWRDPALAVFCWGMAATAVHLLHLTQARLRGRSFRALVSVPGQTFLAASFLAGPLQLLLWPLRAALLAGGAEDIALASRWLDLLPYAVGVLSVATSMRRVPEWVRVQLAGGDPAELVRVPVERWRRRPPAPLEGRPLRIVQITDPHLGPWHSERRLTHTVRRLVALEPDLVLLTGDFLTMEGNASRGVLARALSPLAPIRERCFAIFGNHDHEAPEEVASALREVGIRLLVDEEARIETPVGPVQILGSDHVWKDHAAHLEGLFTAHPRLPDHLRLLMLHDPSAFHHVPPGEVDLTFSGHTHGGQVGLVSLGIDWTVLKGSRWPDHGLFARGDSHLYVHRGTGFYGFPLRVGVPGELSVMELVLD